jgi:hypothetical protein
LKTGEAVQQPKSYMGVLCFNSLLALFLRSQCALIDDIDATGQKNKIAISQTIRGIVDEENETGIRYKLSVKVQ